MSQTNPTIIHLHEEPFEQTLDMPGGRVRWQTLLSADRTPTEALTVGITEIEPSQDKQFFLHEHEQPEVYYILAGHGVVQISGEEHTLKPGSLVFIPGDAPHACATPVTNCCDCCMFLPSIRLTRSLTNFPSRNLRGLLWFLLRRNEDTKGQRMDRPGVDRP